ncbi:MAG TPA: lipid-A-disaccharide synthase [Opitutaceae bacterium]|nr:lipid-A-disaccharide synthase [Opitutaceae bacterium]
MTSSGTELAFSLPPPAGRGVDLLIVAGEHSGDEHAARMVRGLLAGRPALRVCALGGPELAAAGAQLLHDLTASSVVGFVEVLRNVRYFRSLFGATLRWIEQHRPRAVCCVDYPGFNLRLTRALHARGLTVKGGGRIRALYYISPQIWAWKAGRRFEMARHLDAMAVIFPFEVKSYADTALPVEFVGHPFVAGGHESPVQPDAAGPVLLLPGSRRQAVARIFPALLAGYAQYASGHPERAAVVLHPSDEIKGVLEHLRARARPEIAARVELRRTGAPVAAAAVLTSSGTMSMHCALAGIPGAIAYRTNPLTYLFARWLVRVPHIGIANLLLDEPMYPEFIQGAATAGNLARELTTALEDPARRARAAEQARQLRAVLRQPATGTAADWLARQLAPSDGGRIGNGCG